MTTLTVPKKDILTLGVHVQFLSTAESSRGACSVIRYVLPAKRPGAPPHYHKVLTETFYVLKGELTMFHRSRWDRYGPGSLITALPGDVHSFRNDADVPLEALIIATPGGHERLLEGIAEIVAEEGQWPPRDPARLVQLGLLHDTYYVQP